jgi:hypothetical protein
MTAESVIHKIDPRSLDINDLSLFESSEQHDFYARQVVRNNTNKALCVDGKSASHFFTPACVGPEFPASLTHSTK